MSRESAVRIVVVHPELLGTYGDSGNGRVLATRLRWRRIPSELIMAPADRPLPQSGDIYCLGGGEDGPQVSSAAALNVDGSLVKAVDRGAAVLAVCAGFQIIGKSFPGPDGREVPGVGLVDAVTRRGRGPRAVGEVVSRPVPGLRLVPLSGYENHAGVTRLGPEASPLGMVHRGVGNGGGDGTEGAWQDKVLCTYLHGPVLARNAALADHLLSSVVGPLGLLDDAEMEELRRERIRNGISGPATGRAWARHVWRRPSEVMTRF
ncbi:MAG: glutamine amidotransferase [Actinomycetota bacterium]|nr:glutamine amidotransferase [Actinomycetota bacterium]